MDAADNITITHGMIARAVHHDASSERIWQKGKVIVGKRWVTDYPCGSKRVRSRCLD